MPILAKKHTPIPEQDLLSWFFDNPLYDLDKPVCHTKSNVHVHLIMREDLY